MKIIHVKEIYRFFWWMSLFVWEQKTPPYHFPKGFFGSDFQGCERVPPSHLGPFSSGGLEFQDDTKMFHKKTPPKKNRDH